MKADLFDAWLAALRSGQFTKIQDTLLDERSGHYCSVGVLAKITGVPENRLDPKNPTFSFPVRDQTHEEMDEPPPGWIRSVGLNLDQHKAIVRQNDSPSTFDDMAEFIEELVEIESN